jgi:hypothetical protein
VLAGAADRLFAKLKERSDGGERVRTAVLSVTVCKRAWNIARRDKPKIVPWTNPFDKMELTYEPKPTRQSHTMSFCASLKRLTKRAKARSAPPP